MKKKTRATSKLEAFHRLKGEAVAELLGKRKDLKRQLKQEVARIEKALEENASQLRELGCTVKDERGKVAGKNLRLSDDAIKDGLRTFLQSAEGGEASIPDLISDLMIARSRLSAFMDRNPNFLRKDGVGKGTVYRLASR